ncbi:ATP synthase subunit g, mitochondrial [Drosophila subobscura]|uniref:ATP synthase subunit g, mitochondrial n=1 Tax=Drosophila subobscura TaxID=7241 RepID=UPI00155AA253|nr:ATP synthase subunit g, mitochondrial [Drosophila subobscura]
MSQYVGKANALAKTLTALARPPLKEFWKYAKVELSPPLPGDFLKLQKSLKESTKNLKTNVKASGGRLGQVTVREAWLNVLVTVEIVSWFYMGEVIGRRHFVGYKV